jgi:2,4'-dihydroxyacetophenone dioxygenase
VRGDAGDSLGLDTFLDDTGRRRSVAAKSTDSLVWVVDELTGGTFALLQVDPLSGVWVVRSRLPAGSTVQTHLHSGPVTAVTLAGHWSYPDANVTCGPGDYLVEEAATVHSLVVHDQDVDVLFTVAGSITYFDDQRKVERIEDWRTVASEYAEGCAALGLKADVLGDPNGG